MYVESQGACRHGGFELMLKDSFPGWNVGGSYASPSRAARKASNVSACLAVCTANAACVSASWRMSGRTKFMTITSQCWLSSFCIEPDCCGDDFALFTKSSGEDPHRRMPANLLADGAKLWGGSVDTLLSRLAPIAVVAQSGVRVRLASFRGDNTLQRLRGEEQKSRDHYHLNALPTNEHGVVIDIGANVGDVSIAVAIKRPLARVVAIEAVPHLAWLVRYNLWLNNVTEASSCEDLLRSTTPRTACVLNRAISTAGRRHVSVSFNVSESQNAVVTGGSKSGDQSSLRVQAASIDEVLHLVDGTRLPILLLKMDCEGCEFDALPSLGARFADNATIRAFAGEIHQTLLVDRKWLKQHHKSFDTVAPQRTDAEKSALRAALRLRGCETTAWRVHC